MGYIKTTVSVCVIAITGLLAGALAWSAYAENASAELAGEILRFHVLANSDAPEDQALKLLVRDRVLEELSGALAGSGSLAEARELLATRLEDIEHFAEEALRRAGADYAVSASLTRSYFPTRTYMDCSLPAGVYETLRLELGGAEGRNWWCVMFPPLCFVDIAAGSEPEPAGNSDVLKQSLGAESYGIVSDTGTVKIKFKLVEMWQELKHFFTKK